jgi:hypothetical protein
MKYKQYVIGISRTGDNEDEQHYLYVYDTEKDKDILQVGFPRIIVVKPFIFTDKELNK